MFFTPLFLAAGFAGSAFASAIPMSSHSQTSQLFERSQLLSSGCSTTGTASCHNTTAVSDTCCFEYPGGLLMQVQVWDVSPVEGPTDSWTIHGLWPDHCDSTYSSSCDSSRAYTGLGTLLTNNGASDTLAFMNAYWMSNSGTNEAFWEHEWSKHGTCISTLVPACLPSGSATGAEAVAFFQTVVRLFQTLPTYTWLANAGILPSSSATYTYATLAAALKAQSGFTPALDCTSGVLDQISWYFNLRGSVIDGTFVPIDTPASGTCPTSGISYPPKSSGSSTTALSLSSSSTTTTKSTTSTAAASTTTAGTGTTTVATTATATSTTTASTTLPTSATIHASTNGGLLAAGTLSTQTLGTYTLSGTTSSFTMKSSKGSCGVTSGTFSCGSSVTATTFSAVTSGSLLLLASGGSTSFSSDGVPSGSTVYSVYTGTSHTNSYTFSIVSA